ncbi:thymidylate synthase [Ascodesmis nigricans]|uniref:thymidylate synthase n=1 Tax=Ascodesmis nigricans TaxID=341454 RepID=A0A4S2N405_9PEZI|nr:thymidylate synthase [Ascodesmis nigricans]
MAPTTSSMSTTTAPSTSTSTSTDPIHSTTASTNTASSTSVSTSTTAHDHEEHQYLLLVRRILQEGFVREDRTGTGTISLFAPPQLRFSLRNNTLPLLTTKRVHLPSILHELLWFISGSTSATALSPLTKIWDANGSREALDYLGFTSRETGDLGPVYGFQWRHFGAKYVDHKTDYTGQGVDQLAEVMHKLQHKPTDRRIILSAWNPADIPQMALPPCHMFAQFYVSNEKELSCQLYQRSADMGLGVPFNVASYALLTHILAHCAGLKAKELVHVIGDAHVYKDHVEALERQLKRVPKSWPTVKITTEGGGGIEEVDKLKFEDFVVEGYEPHPGIKMKMSV